MLNRLTLAILILFHGILAGAEARAQLSQSAEISGSNNTVVQVIIELSQGDPDWLRTNEAQITKLSERLGVSNALVVNFLGRIDQGDVPRERWPEILAKVAGDYQAFQESAELLAANEPIAKDLIEKAQDAAKRAQFVEADQFLIEAEAQEEAAQDKIREAQKKRQLNLVSFKAIRAQNFTVQLRYAEAAQLYEKAAALAEGFDTGKQTEMLSQAAAGYALAGYEDDDSAALDKALSVYRDKLIPLISKGSNQMVWARTQSHIGNILKTFGERETGTARLKEAVAAFGLALEVQSLERAPMLWATTQTSMGHALWSLGEREDSVARFEEAVIAYRAALQWWTRTRAPRMWAGGQHSLGTALWALGERETGTAHLEEAVEAFRASLDETLMEQSPLDWASTQSYLGSALATLGTRKRSAQLIRDGIAATQSAWDAYKAAGQTQHDDYFTKQLAGFDATITKLGQ